MSLIGSFSPATMAHLLKRKPHGVVTGWTHTLSAALFFGDEGQVSMFQGFVDRETHVVCVQVRPLAPTDFWLDGRTILHHQAAQVFSTHLIAAGKLPRAICYGSFGVLQLFLPAALVAQTANQLGAESQTALRLVDPRFRCDPEIALIAREIYYLLECHDEMSRTTVDMLGLRLALRLLHRWSNLRDLKPVHAPALSSDEICRMRKAVSVDYASEWSVERLANLVGHSVREFSRRFQRALECAPERWIEDERLDATTGALLQTTLPLTEIARIHGWRSTRHLRHVLEARWGVTPDEIRRLRLN